MELTAKNLTRYLGLQLTDRPYEAACAHACALKIASVLRHLPKTTKF